MENLQVYRARFGGGTRQTIQPQIDVAATHRMPLQTTVTPAITSTMAQRSPADLMGIICSLGQCIG